MKLEVRRRSEGGKSLSLNNDVNLKDSTPFPLLGWDSTKEFLSDNKEEMIKRYYAPGINRMMLLTADMENLKTIDFKK